jgi:hypothetical protein
VVVGIPVENEPVVAHRHTAAIPNWRSARILSA